MSSDLTPDRPPRPGMRFALRFLLAGLLVAFAVGATVAVAIEREADDVVDAFKQDGKGSIAPATKGALDDVESGKPQTLLLVGDDYRSTEGETGGQRSDTMILLRLDPDAAATTMLSLPRDLEVTTANGSTAKLNSAFSGGTAQLIETLKKLLSTPEQPFRINHVVTIRFTAFSQVVNEFNCFYADIDRKYFNDNNPPAGGGEPYAVIDVAAGYQRLCGEDSLSYVRFRHLDSDLVREARQTHFLSEARAQMADSTLLTKRKQLLKAIGKYVDTDIESSKGLLGVVKLGLDVVGHPTKRVELEVVDAPNYNVATTPAKLAAAAQEFLHPKIPPKAKRTDDDKPASAATPKKATKKGKKRTPKVPDTLFPNPAPARELIASSVAPDLDELPIYYPKLMDRKGRYQPKMARGYDLASPAGTRFPWQAYRIPVWVEGRNLPGQYYGIQGTTWTDPPILKLATDEENLGGRKFLVEYDGSKIRRLSWQAPKATYWISNTLNNQLTNNEMRALARSLTRYNP